MSNEAAGMNGGTDVLRLCLKTDSDGANVTSNGSSFHMLAPETDNATGGATSMVMMYHLHKRRHLQ